MFEFTSLPTDNLHKFKAIAGLVMIFSIYYPFYRIEELCNDVIQVNMEAELLKHDYQTSRDRLEKRIEEQEIAEDSFGKFFDAQMKEVCDTLVLLEKQKTNDGVNEMMTRIKKMDSLLSDRTSEIKRFSTLTYKEIDSVKYAVNRKIIEIRAKAQIIKYKIVVSLLYVAVAAILANLGIQLTRSGFREWHKAQVRYDQIATNEASTKARFRPIKKQPTIRARKPERTAR